MSLSCAIIGAGGYAGGELLRLLLGHPEFEVKYATSESNAGNKVSMIHPNLRSLTNLAFCRLDEAGECDVVCAMLPHGASREHYDYLKALAKQVYIDGSQEFRLDKDFVYAVPEIYREQLRTTNRISGAGCNATAVILALYPFYKEGLVEIDRTVVEVKISSSAAGNSPSLASHHPERNGVVRSYKPTGHRHTREICKVLGVENLHFSATSIDMVRGILATCHIFTKNKITDKDIWKLYRAYYEQEPFIRIVKDRTGVYRYPEPKLLTGTNFCDLGFEVDEQSNRVVLFSAIDNLTKGSAGHLVHALNIRFGFNERLGLEFPGLHPC